MIARVWKGWTTATNADAYETVLKTEILPGISAKGVRGYRGIKLLRRPLGDEVEFVTIMWFDSLQTIKTFAGEDNETAYVRKKARRVLARYDERSQHHDISKSRDS